MSLGALLSIALLLGAASNAQAQFQTPEAAIEALYALYPDDGRGFGRDAKTVNRFFTPELAKLYRGAKNIEADYFIQAQDFQIRGLKVTKGAATEDKASVTANFKNMDQATKITFSLTRGKDGWRIDDADAGNGQSLRKSLRSSR